ncbi:MAG: hypothetical protein MZW92_09590 [Comamonadaceae bacterium]|nr:hypothetical protein [Comamonadaceae bacterium]
MLTDGRLYLGDRRRGIQGLQLARRARPEDARSATACRSASSPAATPRSSRTAPASLGIRHLRQGAADKLPVYEEHGPASSGLKPEQIAFVGDDVVDLPIMLRVGLAVSPARRAFRWSGSHSHWVTPNDGGRGCGRDVCELLMLAQGTLGVEMQRYYWTRPAP